ncbi:TPA: pheST operon leader peptide PheM [Yersinia enterocolitica]|uniref:pheST attenuator peptide n=1 Tax=Yersinia massiliensis TaxID=419257 RepID=A0AA90XV99_9GAMM|nr:pheST operon leader peptide PheM [Yersinia massiliensis]QKJ13666.1 pheST operon leader peptide PheM [Yersinia massiliensis]HEC1649156.1 pheST operon leader peptide PheM [Yersinia enterocolitica]HEI6964452.1 pheST operon leader peptide PheM [Yersinia enterocolitica]
MMHVVTFRFFFYFSA